MTAPATDLLGLDAELTDEERAVRDTVRKVVDDHVKPVIARHWREGTYPKELYPRFVELGLIGANIEGYDCAGMGPLAYGLVMRELERGDSCIRSMVGVQTSLVMWPIYKYGSEEQKASFLPALAKGERVGCFGLSEPDAGSDPAAMRTKATKVEGGWRITGTKRWITSGTTSDFALIWAKTDDGTSPVDQRSIRGFLVDKSLAGFRAEAIDNKQSFRASDTAELILEDVLVKGDAILPGSAGLKSALAVLNQGRFGIFWGVLGSAEACLACALDFAQQREAFGKPIAGYQLVQKKLVEMAQKISLAQLLALRLARLKEKGDLAPHQVSLGKLTCVRTALEVAREARDILAANGIMDEYPVMRHMNNLETVFTYEGTHDVHLLVLGHALTGHSAFRG